MSFVCVLAPWGDAPGYGENWPSAKLPAPDTPAQNRRIRLVSQNHATSFPKGPGAGLASPTLQNPDCLQNHRGQNHSIFVPLMIPCSRRFQSSRIAKSASSAANRFPATRAGPIRIIRVTNSATVAVRPRSPATCECRSDRRRLQWWGSLCSPVHGMESYHPGIVSLRSGST